MLKQLQTMDRNRLGAMGLALAAVLFVAANIAFNLNLRQVQLDLTEGGLFTVSEGTEKVLTGLKEPVTLRLYFSQGMGEAFPDIAAYHTRVREFMERYAEISGGMVKVRFLDPAPFSPEEDEAVTFGLQGVPYNPAGDQGYFGLAGTNAVDGEEVVPFFSVERAQHLEYDLTKLIYNLSVLERPVVGILSRLPIEGGVVQGRRPEPPWLIIDQIREFYEIRSLPSEVDEIPEDVDVLMLVHPKRLSDGTRYAIDQFVLGGGRAMVFVDPNPELEPAGPGVRPGPSRLDDLMKAWGISLVPKKVAADVETARRVSVRHQGFLTAVDYVAWNTLGREQMNVDDAIIGDISAVNIGTAGILEPLPGAASQVTPLLTTSGQSQAIDVAKFQGRIDIVALFREFSPQPIKRTIAARVTGDIETAFPGGPPTEAAASIFGVQKKKNTRPANIVVVADTDILHEGLWADVRQFGSERLAVPFANNAHFVINALENLAGSDALLSLRSRGDARRPFTLVEDLRQEAERTFRAKQDALVKKLGETQARLDELTSREQAGGGAPVLSGEERRAIESFRREMVGIRKELRDVQLALRKDIEALESRLTFLNIGGIPLLLGLAALVVFFVRRARRRANGRAAQVGGGA